MLWNSKARKSVVAVYRDHYEAHARLRPSSVKRYRCELNRWEKLVGDVPIRKVETEHFEQFRSGGLASGLKADTIESTVKIVKAVLRYSRDRGWIDRLPVWGKALPSEAPEPEPATLDEISSLYLVADHARLFGCGPCSPSAGFRAWLALDLWTGLRLMDMSLNLERCHIHWDRECIRFKASKTGRPHIFPITEPVARHLKLLDGRPGESLFGIRNGSQVDRELARLCEVAGIRKISAQNIRQASVTEWDALGVGHLIHGCGLNADGEKVPRIMRNYLGVLRRLQSVADRFPWPECMLPDGGPRSIKLHG